MTIIDGHCIDVDVEGVLAFMGYNDENPASKRLLEAAHKMLERCLDLVRPRSVYSVHEIGEVNGEFVRIGDAEFKGQILKRILSGSVMAAVAVGTVGIGIDEEIERLNSKGDTVSALILDTMGIVALMRARVLFLGELYDREAKPRGFSATPPYGPGQCHWDIREQRELFSLVDADSVGVKLTESYLMIPKKSVSGIIGLGPEGRTFDMTPCDICDRVDCQGRRMRGMIGGLNGA
ncbi:MAG: hypothetical protein JW984_15385 [Deltaproteobacteria bacterium]|uniref:AdoMet activation domain-containing protein n=1 Tax=Candidatus Zymogenus saltonus TaxID=2844893 RepID=A0A9D8PPV2_9DELT|nr:hypothetical protein [Candidatus Zymogenus saltonus]